MCFIENASVIDEKNLSELLEYLNDRDFSGGLRVC